MAPWRASCQVSISRCVSFRMASSCSTTRSGGRPPCALAHAHAAARGDEAHADLLRGLDAVVQPHAVGVDVEVVAAGGAARQQQLGHRHLGADLHHLGRQAGPDRVQRRAASRTARRPARPESPVSAIWYMWWWVLTRPGITRWPRASITSSAVCGRSAAGPMASIRWSRMKTDASAQFAPVVVEGGHAAGIADQQGRHGMGCEK